MSGLQDAIHRAIPVMREEWSGAIYEAKTSATIEGYVVDLADWRTITKAARRVANPPRDQIAHTIMVYSWSTDAMKDMQSPVEAYDLTDKVIVALGITEATDV